MKAISLLQPWASLIMLGYKLYETRSWATKHRGPLAIAASAGKKGREACAPGTDLAVLLANHGLTFDDLPRGAILGVCSVESMHKMDETWDLVLSDTELSCGDYSNGRVAWALASVQAFATPIDCKGKLSLWEVPAEVEEQFPLSSAPVSAPNPRTLSRRCQGYGTLLCHCGGDHCMCGLDGEHCPGCPDCEYRAEDDYEGDDAHDVAFDCICGAQLMRADNPQQCTCLREHA